MTPHRLPSALVLAAAVLAASAPTLLAYNVAPSPTFYNQALAFALWGGFVLVCLPHKVSGAAWPLWAALALMAAAVLWSWGALGLPSGLTLTTLAMLGGCAVLVGAGLAAGQDERAEHLFALFCWAWLAAGVVNLVLGGLQVFAPGLVDRHWIALSNYPGRAVGNLRQPNHLSSVFMWSCVATMGLLLLKRLTLKWAAVLMAALVLGVVLTASRTGLVSVLLLALWALVDRRLPRQARLLLLATPVMYAACWWGMAQWAAATQATFGGSQRLAEGDISSSRFGIWSNTLALIKAQPWTGVGFGNFNMAWTLTPFPGRPVAFFDHTHNLPLQLAVEMGLPLTACVLGLLVWALVRALRNSLGQTVPGLSAAQRCACMAVLMIGLHSQLEYPLWYAYFLLPAGWAFGFAMAPPRPSRLPDAPALARGAALPATPGATTSRYGVALGAAAALLVLAAVLSVLDYRRVTVIFTSRLQDASLEARIAAGQHAVLFGHHADYAAANAGPASKGVSPAFDRASHYLLDTRLLMAWADALQAQGDTEMARHLAARLREFRKPEAARYFAPCSNGVATATADAASAMADAPASNYMCEAPTASVDWRRFLKTAR